METYIKHSTRTVPFATETVSVSRKKLMAGDDTMTIVAREEAAAYDGREQARGQYLSPAARLLADLYLKSLDKEADAQ